MDKKKICPWTNTKEKVKNVISKKLYERFCISSSKDTKICHKSSLKLNSLSHTSLYSNTSQYSEVMSISACKNTLSLINR